MVNELRTGVMVKNKRGCRRTSSLPIRYTRTDGRTWQLLRRKSRSELHTKPICVAKLLAIIPSTTKSITELKVSVLANFGFDFPGLESANYSKPTGGILTVRSELGLMTVLTSAKGRCGFFERSYRPVANLFRLQ